MDTSAQITEDRKYRKTGRRSALATGAGIMALGAAGCNAVRERVQEFTGPDPAQFDPLPSDSKAVAAVARVLNRVSFGPRPGDIARVINLGGTGHQNGIKNYLEEQLADQMEESSVIRWRVESLEVQQWETDAPDMLYSYPDGQLLTETQQAALLRAVYSRHQLRETLCDFWTNHFNIYAIKKEGRVLVPTDTEQTIRPNALGKFRDMLVKSAHSPAMLAYLDNEENKKGVANENYARELLELHTVGVNSGYTLEDIQQVARSFTGWTIKGGYQRGQFVFSREQHDNGEKFIPFLNLTLVRNGGKKDADTILERLALHPATARFLSRKLCLRYLGCEPQPLIEKAANAYLKNDTDIRAMLRPILLEGLTSPDCVQPILKRPLDYTVSALRTLAADTDGGSGVQRYLQAMGQPLYQWPMPDGYPDKTAAWTGTLLPRWNFALALAANTIEGTRIDLSSVLQSYGAKTDEAILDALTEITLSRPANDPGVQAARKQVAEHMKRARKANLPSTRVIAEATGLLLSSPAFQWRA